MKTIVLSGMIGEDILPADLRKSLAEAKGGPVRLELASAGGYIAIGMELASILKGYSGYIEARLCGICASAASFLACFADKVVALPHALFMIHGCSGAALGNAKTMSDMAAVMQKFDAVMAQAYARKSGKSIEEVQALMSAETWFSAQEAQDAGFVDEVLDGASASASALTEAKASFSALKAHMAAAPCVIDESRIAALAGDLISTAPRTPLSAEDAAAAKLAGMDPDEYRKYAKPASASSDALRFGVTDSALEAYERRNA